MKKLVVLQGILCILLCYFCIKIANTCMEESKPYQEEDRTYEKVRILIRNQNTQEEDYRGKIRIKRTEDGREKINEVSLEEYLYGVVGSEMPSSYPEEALKAQAVCARSYAVCRMQNPASSQYDMDDTTSFQVYSPENETDAVRNAVDETKGEILSYEGMPAETFFFSTSCGLTTDADVFNQKGGEYPYIVSQAVGYGENPNSKEDFTKEDVFQNYILGDSEDAFESGEKWFRWSTTVRLDQIEAEGLKKGSVKEVNVLDRGPGGVVSRLSVSDGKNMVEIEGEYRVRCLLAQAAGELSLNDGTETACASLLPSAYFIIENTEDENEVRICGGGYGHGAGMPQNAAKAMAEQGMDYREILAFFFEDTKLTTLG